ncbi:unnamed protein product [Arabidopsis halleri]
MITRSKGMLNLKKGERDSERALCFGRSCGSRKRWHGDFKACFKACICANLICGEQRDGTW